MVKLRYTLFAANLSSTPLNAVYSIMAATNLINGVLLLVSLVCNCVVVYLLLTISESISQSYESTDKPTPNVF